VAAVITVPIAVTFNSLGVPTLTAPFVLSSWLAIALLTRQAKSAPASV
jgi:urea transporter